MNKQNSRIISYTLLVGLSAIFLMPIYWMLATSLKSKSDLFAYPPVFFPRTLEWSNYLGVFETINFFRLTGNSLLITVLVVIGTLISAPLTAYACSHIQWRGKNILFIIVMATLLLPYQVTMLPIYIIWSKMGMIGSYIPLILPAFLSVGV